MKPFVRLSFFFAIAFAATLRGQNPAGTLSISGIVLGSNGVPLPYSTVSIQEIGAERFANERGEFTLAGLAAGTYHLKIRQLGFGAVDTAITLGSKVTSLKIVLSPVAFRLATVTVKGMRGCIAADDAKTSEDFAAILLELRKNAERERLLVTSYPFEYRIERAMSSDDGALGRRWNDTVSYRSDARPKYAPGKLVRPDSSRGANSRMMVIPVLEDLGDPEFLRTHCFTYAGLDRDGDMRTHRIDFKPTRTIKASDIEGSVFLDTASFVIRRAEFRMTRPELVGPEVRELQVTSKYREILPGVAVVGDVQSVQVMRGPYVASRVVRVSEKQKLLDFTFLGTRPGEGVPRR